MTNLHKKTTSVIYRIEEYEIEQQYDDYGNHCIVIRNMEIVPWMYLSSDWVNYRQFSDVIMDNKTFIGVSDYYTTKLPSVFRMISPSIPILKVTKENDYD